MIDLNLQNKDKTIKRKYNKVSHCYLAGIIIPWNF